MLRKYLPWNKSSDRLLQINEELQSLRDLARRSIDNERKMAAQLSRLGAAYVEKCEDAGRFYSQAQALHAALREMVEAYTIVSRYADDEQAGDEAAKAADKYQRAYAVLLAMSES